MSKIFPLITAHAGCMNTTPNSIENFLTGIEAGADIVEFDVNSTKDGVPVLFHDHHIQISPNRTILLQDLSFEELQKLENQRVLRLEEGLDCVRPLRKTLNLDLKHPTCLPQMAEAVKFRKMEDTVIISGCHKEHALTVKKQSPEFQVLLNAGGRTHQLNAAEYTDYAIKTCRDAVEASCCGLNMHYKDFRREMFFYARLRCLPVLIYTVDDTLEMEKLIADGVHSITTNEVATLAALKTRFVETVKTFS